METIPGCDTGTIDTPIPPIPPNTSNPFDWTIQESETGESFKDIWFINTSNGWAVGNNVVAATVNGGATWPLAPLNISGSDPDQFNSVFFTSGQNGWIVGSGDENNVGKVFISQQGGAYPTLRETFTNPLNSIFFLDDLTAWAGGDNGQMIFTDDGGLNWGELINLDSTIYDVHFTSGKSGWVVGDNGTLFSTADGLNFQLEDLGTTQALNAVHFTDTLHGWICGNGNTIYRRYLEAENQVVWSPVPVEEVALTDWNDIYFIDALNGWIVGNDGSIYKSSDGGINWTYQTSDAFENLNAIHMVSSTKGWIAGDDGIILTYTP